MWKTVFFFDSKTKTWVLLTFESKYGKFRVAVKDNAPTDIQSYDEYGNRVVGEIGSTMGDSMSESLQNALKLVPFKKK